MAHENFWNYVEAMTAALESDADLAQAEWELAKMPPDEKQQKRGRLRVLAAKLARLELRMIAAEN